MEDKILKLYCKRRGLPYDEVSIRKYQKLLDNAFKRTKDPMRKTLMQRDN